MKKRKEYWTRPSMSIGHRHLFTTDGMHLNEFCSVCFVDSPRWIKLRAKLRRH